MADLETDVEEYAALAAAIADPTADRAALLAARGLDEEGWDALDDAWQARLWPDDAEDAGDEDGSMPALLLAYSEAFARAQRARAPSVVLGFDRFVEAARAMKRGTDLKMVLQRLDLTLESYLAAQRHWTEAMIRDDALAARFRRGVG